VHLGLRQISLGCHLCNILIFVWKLLTYHSLDILQANQLADLNAMSTSTIEEFDYNRRLQAYERMDTPFFSHLNRPMALLILSHVVYDMGSDDMSLRHSSSSCLQAFVRFASSLPEEECPEDLRGVNRVFMVESEVATGNALYETVEEGLDVLEKHPKGEAGSVRSLVERFLLPHVRNGMASELLVVRRVKQPNTSLNLSRTAGFG
jgi:hypothetical protein